PGLSKPASSIFTVRPLTFATVRDRIPTEIVPLPYGGRVDCVCAGRLPRPVAPAPIPEVTNSTRESSDRADMLSSPKIVRKNLSPSVENRDAHAADYASIHRATTTSYTRSGRREQTITGPLQPVHGVSKIVL